MTHDESRAFIKLLTAYKQFWVATQVEQAMQHLSAPSAGSRETIWAEIDSQADQALEPVWQAIEAGGDVLAALRPALESLAPPDSR